MRWEYLRERLSVDDIAIQFHGLRETQPAHSLFIRKRTGLYRLLYGHIKTLPY